MPIPLSTRSLRDLLRLFEHAACPVLDRRGRRLHGVPTWEIGHLTELSAAEVAAWTESIGYAAQFPAPCGDGREVVDLLENDDDSWPYRCPETHRLKRLHLHEAAVRAVPAADMLGVIADLLDIPKALRSGIERPSVPETLWHLGRARIGEAHAEVWFVRGLAIRIDEVFAALSAPGLPERSLLLSGGPGLVSPLRPPRQCRVAPIVDALSPLSATPVIDREWLARLLAGDSNTGRPEPSAVRFEASDRMARLTITTRALDPWTITGKRQIAAVAYLYDQYRQQRAWVRAADILDAARDSSGGGRSKTVPSLFAGNEHWTTYIARHPSDKGRYGFRLD